MALDMALRGPLTDDEFAPPVEEATPAAKPVKSVVPEGGISEALGGAIKRGESLYSRAEDLGTELGEARDIFSSMKPPSLVDLQTLMESRPTPKKTDPIESFGSAASLAAIFGSLLTRQPMVNALENAAGVMEAYKAKDVATAKSEFDAWEANVKNAETLFKFQNDAYEAAFKHLETNSKLASDEMRMLTSAFDDSVLKPLIEQGRWQNARELLDKRMALHNQVTSAKPGLLDYNTRYSGFLTEALELGLQEGTAEWLAKYNEWMTKPSAGSAGRGMTLNQAIDNARQEYKLVYGQDAMDHRSWERRHAGEKVPTYETFEDEWLKKLGFKDAAGNAIAEETSSVDTKPKLDVKPVAVPLPAAFTDRPDKATFRKDGWLWEKRGSQLVPIKRLE
jgi:hypothetical protein